MINLALVFLVFFCDLRNLINPSFVSVIVDFHFDVISHLIFRVIVLGFAYLSSTQVYWNAVLWVQQTPGV